MSVYEIDIATLEGEAGKLSEQAGNVTLMVNVASRCGLTPQYEPLQALHDKYSERGFSVLGFPCNQFLEQEPGTPEEIRTFCTNEYGVDFPLFEKIEVNGEGRHRLYAALTEIADAESYVGDIRWNFEKFLVSRDGEVVARFAPTTAPDDPAVVEAIEAALGA